MRNGEETQGHGRPASWSLKFHSQKKKKRKNWQLSNDKRQLGLQLEVNPRGGENVAEPKAAKDIWE